MPLLELVGKAHLLPRQAERLRKQVISAADNKLFLRSSVRTLKAQDTQREQRRQSQGVDLQRLFAYVEWFI